MDALDWLALTAGADGEVSAVYGGFEIRVERPDRFPWGPILERLLDMRHEVWVDRVDGALRIRSRPGS